MVGHARAIPAGLRCRPASEDRWTAYFSVAFFWLNKKFVAPPSSQQQAWVDDSYRTAIESLEVIDSFACKPSDVVLDSATVRLRAQGDIEYPVIRFGDAFRFDFLPFEVSHLFHLRERKHDKSRVLVSCCGDTIGYLPHPSQLLFGGYEVDGSRKYMNLEDRVEIQSAEFQSDDPQTHSGD